MQNVNINFSNTTISDSKILNKANIGNTVINAVADNDTELQQIIAGLTAVLNTTTDKTEKRCADRALGLVQKNKMDAFWDFVKKNLGTFITGTFTNVVGGTLLEIIKAKFNP